MAVAQGTCPACGAPIEFGVGASIAKVCDYCHATVVRTDRGLENLGKVADIVDTPSLIAVGDQGTLAGRPFEVLGRVQLDHGTGPWDEYYVGFDYGQNWGWLAYAQGHWYVTSLVPGLAIPPLSSLMVEMDVSLGQAGVFRVAEVKSARVVSAEGELPSADPPGTVRYYADCYGQKNAFATLDYGANTGSYSVFIGWIFAETQMQVTALGPRSQKKVLTTSIKCPNCGGDIPKLSGDRAQRVGCPYCGAVSDIAAQQVVAQQEAVMRTPDIPIGSRGTFGGDEYVCTAYMRRSSDFDGERFSWEEYLLWSKGLGFRWLVKDETTWMWVTDVNLAEIDLSAMPGQVAWNGRVFAMRNTNMARVDYVLGEVFWQAEVGETTQATDFVNGGEVLSREVGGGEAHWSYSAPVAWAVIAGAFNLPLDGPGGRFAPAAMSTFGGDFGGGSGGSPSSGASSVLIMVILIGIVLLVCAANACGGCGSSYGGSSYRGGSGIYFGGK